MKIPRSSIIKLPVDVIIEVKRKLRAGQFDQADVLLWLDGLGYKISKSAISRFAVKLYNEDKKLGHDREFMANQGGDILALFEELSAIRVRETEIISQLKTIMSK